MGVQSSFAKFSAVLGLMSLFLHGSSCYKTINEVCQPNLSNPTDYRNCDSSQFLVCGPARVCACNTNMIWQQDLESCTFTLNAICVDQFGGSIWPPGQGDGHHGGNGPSPSCPHNAYCDASGSRKCRCNEGAEPSEDYTECNGANAFQNLTSITFAILISYFVAMKLLI